MERRWWLAALAVFVVLAAVGLWLLLRDGGSDSSTPAARPSGPRSTVSLPPPVTSQLDPEASELVDLLKAGRGRTFHARYQASGPDVGGTLTLELFRKDGKVRQDTRLESDGAVALTAGFLLDDDTTVTCTRRNEEPWVCGQSAGSAETAIDGVFGSVASQVAGADVTVEEATVAGRAAQCFSFPTEDGKGQLCITDEGVPVRATVNGTEIVLSGLDERVDDDVFRPPAKPVQGEG